MCSVETVVSFEINPRNIPRNKKKIQKAKIKIYIYTYINKNLKFLIISKKIRIKINVSAFQILKNLKNPTYRRH